MNAPAKEFRDLTLPIAPPGGLAPSLERKRLQVYLAQIIIDGVLLLGCFAVATEAYFGEATQRGQPMLAGQLMLPIFLTIALYNGTYSLASLSDWRIGSRRALVSLVLAAVLLNFFAFFAKSNAVFSRVVFTAGLASASFLMVLARAAIQNFASRLWGPMPINRLIIQAGGPPIPLEPAYRVEAKKRSAICSSSSIICAESSPTVAAAQRPTLLVC